MRMSEGTPYPEKTSAHASTDRKRGYGHVKKSKERKDSCSPHRLDRGDTGKQAVLCAIVPLREAHDSEGQTARQELAPLDLIRASF